MERKRWRVVAGALIVQICLGAIYAWGAFVPALKASKAELTVMLSPKLLEIDSQTHKEVLARYSELKKEAASATGAEKETAKTRLAVYLSETVTAKAPAPEAAWKSHYFGFSGKQTQGIFSIGLLAFALAMIFAGKWQDRVGPRKVALTGGAVLGLGYIAASLVGTNFIGLALCVGLAGGVGIGLGYVCPIAACVKWFPDMKGFITGLAVAGFGGGAFLFIKLAGSWGNLVADYGVSATFLVFGIIFLVAVPLGSLLLSNPPPGWRPAGWVPASPTGKNPTVSRELTQGETVRTSEFWLAWFAFVFSAGCGLMVIGSLKDFGVREGGLSEAAAGGALALLALFNGLGRIVWGSVSQRLTPQRSIVLMSLLQGGMMFCLLGMGSSPLTLAIGGCWVGFNFGGNFALFPLLTAEMFGSKNLGANYGAVFTAYGVGGVIGPMLAGGVWDAFQTYKWAFIPAGGACLLAAALAMILHPHHEAPQPAAVPSRTAGAH